MTTIRSMVRTSRVDLENELRDARDTIARLTRERDEARAGLDAIVREFGEPVDLPASLATPQAGRALDLVRDLFRQKTDEADALLDAAAEVERLRAGLEELVRQWGEPGDPSPGEFFAGCAMARSSCADAVSGLLASAETEEER